MKNATISIYQAEMIFFMIEDTLYKYNQLIERDNNRPLYQSRIRALTKLQEEMQSIIDKESEVC